MLLLLRLHLDVFCRNFLDNPVRFLWDTCGRSNICTSPHWVKPALVCYNAHISLALQDAWLLKETVLCRLISKSIYILIILYVSVSVSILPHSVSKSKLRIHCVACLLGLLPGFVLSYALSLLDSNSNFVSRFHWTGVPDNNLLHFGNVSGI